MGLLDDAIREHLELKRRHGADPDEVARQENEALGATRRAEFARPEGSEAASDAAAAAPEPTAEPAAPPEPSAEPAAPPEFSPGAETPEPSAAAPEPAPAAHEPSPEAAPPEFSPAAEPPEPSAPSPEPSPEVAAPAAEPPAGEREPFDIEAEEPPPNTDPWLEDARDEVPADETLEHPRADPEEDVLEETPDFLQETPEHDRLWFEQRPPRDFDWDK
jgi:hypothetical protein